MFQNREPPFTCLLRYELTYVRENQMSKQLRHGLLAPHKSAKVVLRLLPTLFRNDGRAENCG